MRCYEVSTVFPRLPPIYRGSRLLMCVMLSIGVAAFFLAYAHITHPGMPAFSQSLKSATIGTSPPAMPGYGHFDQPPLPLPDMDSPAVKLASADVLQVQNAFDSEAIQPRKSRI